MNYQKIYTAFIADRRTTEDAAVLLSSYLEKHHIVPRSLGGDDTPGNLIRLTPEDHFFAHLLLAKIHGGKLWYALRSMYGDPGGRRGQSEGYLRRRRKAYACSRKGFAQVLRQRFEAGELYVQTPEFRAASSARQKAQVAAGTHHTQRPGAGAAQRAAILALGAEGRLWGQSEEGRKHMSKKLREWWEANPATEAQRAVIGARSKAMAAEGRLYVQSPEGREKVRQWAKSQCGEKATRFVPTVHTLVDAAGATVRVTQLEMNTKLGLTRPLANLLVKGKISTAKGWSIEGVERKTLGGEKHPRYRPEVHEFRHVKGEVFVGTQFQFSEAMKFGRPAVSNLVRGHTAVTKGWYMAAAGFPELKMGSRWAKLLQS